MEIPTKNLPNIEFTSRKQERLEAKQYADMDPKTARIRDRLAKRLNQQDQKVTKQALQDTKLKIGQWIERHHKTRQTVKGKATMSLFSGGQSVAAESTKIKAIRAQLAESFESSNTSFQPLKGRITKQSS